MQLEDIERLLKNERAIILRKFNGLEKEHNELREILKEKTPIELVTKMEASEMFKVDPSTIDQWIKQGRLKVYKMGSRVYFKRHELFEGLVAAATN